MAQLDFQINVQGNAGEAVGSLKKQLREAQQEVVALSDKFGATSQEAIKAAKRAAELRDRIGDAKALTDAFNPDAKFKALTSSLSGVAGGFAAVQGAIGLFGTESKNVEKALLKVQSAMALSQGLQAIGESVDSFKQLKAVVIDVGSKAFGSLRAAIISTGIGALVIGLGLLIANFDKVKKAVLGFIPELGKVADFFGKLVNSVTDFIGVTSEAERQLEKLQKTTARGNEEIQGRIKILQAQGGKEKEIYSESQKLIENDLNVLRKTLSAKGELTEEEQKKFRELNIEKEVLRANETKRIQEENKKQADDNKKKNDEILKQNEEARQKQLEIEQKRRDEVLGVEKEIEQIKNQTALVGLSEKDKRLLELQQELDANLAKYKDNLDARQKAYILYEEGVKLANATTKEEERVEEVKTNETFLNNLGKRGMATMAVANATIETNQNIAKSKIALSDIEKQKTEEQTSMALESLNILSGMVDKNSIAGKAIAVAQSIINTYQGASKAIAQGGTFGPILAGVTIAAGLLNVKKIISTKIPSAKGGGDVGGGGSVPSISSAAPVQPQIPQAATTNLSSSTINALGNQAIKAYVVETDVTTNQQRIKAIQQRARFD